MDRPRPQPEQPEEPPWVPPPDEIPHEPEPRDPAQAPHPPQSQKLQQRRTPTMADVAQAAGVSRALVSLVMRRSPKVAPETRDRVKYIAMELGYRYNATASSLARRRSYTIGVVLDDLRNPFFAEIAGGIEESAGNLGYTVLLGAGNREAFRERQAVNALMSHQVDGLVLVSPRMRSDGIRVTAREAPTVLVGRRVRSADADVVINDERAGVELVMDHLLSLGHTEIAHVDGGRGPGGPQRRTAYERWMRNERLGRRIRVLAGDFTEEAGIEAATALLAERERVGRPLPTAVFAANDLIAAGLLGELDRAGVSVPGEVSIAGYDDSSIAHLARVSLTTVHQPRGEMGRMALELLHDRIEDRRPAGTRLVAPHLVVRATTAPPRTAIVGAPPARA